MSRSRKLKKAAPRTAGHGRGEAGVQPAVVATAAQSAPELTTFQAEPEPEPEPEADPEPEPEPEPEPVPTTLRAEPEPTSRRARPWLPKVALAVLGPVALIAGFMVPLIAINHDEPASEAPPAALTSSPSASLGTAKAPSAGPSAQPQSGYAPGILAGPGQTRPGIFVQAQPDAQGDLEVVERVWFESPQRVLMLGLPSLRGVTGDVAALKPRVEELQVSADGELVSVPEKSRVFTAASLLELPRAARALVLRYRVANASSRSLPGPPGRALVVMPPISTMPDAAALPVVVEVSGGTVRNLLCPGLDRKHQLCGHAYGATWYTTELRAGETAVVAQVDLPAPGA